MTQPLVSIVMPTYNRAHLLRGAIDNVLAQTWRTLELIIVDDNSSDETPRIVAAITDPRVRYLRNDPNLRLPRALNRGFAAASGEYLTWTSDDNLFAPEAIERMVDVLHRGEADFVYADYHQFSEVDASGRPTDLRHERLPSRPQLERSNHIGACFLYTRAVRDAVGDYDPELFLVEDYDYFIRIAQRFRLAHIAEPLYYFRRDDQTLYLSRYREVKASDALLRYRHDLIDEEAVIAAVANWLWQAPDGLNDPLIRLGRNLQDRVSYRLGVWYLQTRLNSLQRRLRPGITAILRRYRDGELGFVVARDALLVEIERFGRLSYPAKVAA